MAICTLYVRPVCIIDRWTDHYQRNILVTRSGHRPEETHTDFEIDILITDFGLSVYHEDQSRENFSWRGGYKRFKAPECQEKGIPNISKRPSPRSDVFGWAAMAYNVRTSFIACPACDVLIYCQLMTTKPPYEDKMPQNIWDSRSQPLDLVGKAIVNFETPSQTLDVRVGEDIYSVTVPKKLWEMIEGCWTHPERRLTMEDIIPKLRSMQISINSVVAQWKPDEDQQRTSISSGSITYG